jgi:hypothetical protein
MKLSITTAKIKRWSTNEHPNCIRNEGFFQLFLNICKIKTKISCLGIHNKTCSTFFVVNYQNFYLATLSAFHKKKHLSDCPVGAIRMAVNCPSSYVDINRKILKCKPKWLNFCINISEFYRFYHHLATKIQSNFLSKLYRSYIT